MSMPDRFWFLFCAYAAIWLLLALFLVRMGRQHRVLERNLEEIRARLAVERSRRSPPPASPE